MNNKTGKKQTTHKIAVTKQYFTIADHHICLCHTDDDFDAIKMVPSFEKFKAQGTPDRLLFTLTLDNSIKPVPKSDRKILKRIDTGNGITSVSMFNDNSFQFIIRDIYGNDCCLMIINHDYSECRCALNGSNSMRTFGYNNAIMLTFSFAGAFHQTMLIHASCIKYQGYAYPFMAVSGTGKSTHTSMWMQNIEGAELINDDQPIVRIKDDEVMLYGSPWSGKTTCYRNIKAPLGAITFVERAPFNTVEVHTPLEYFIRLMKSTMHVSWNPVLHDNICNNLKYVIEHVPGFVLRCLPNAEAAQVCREKIAR